MEVNMGIEEEKQGTDASVAPKISWSESGPLLGEERFGKVRAFVWRHGKATENQVQEVRNLFDAHRSEFEESRLDALKNATLKEIAFRGRELLWQREVLATVKTQERAPAEHEVFGEEIYLGAAQSSQDVNALCFYPSFETIEPEVEKLLHTWLSRHFGELYNDDFLREALERGEACYQLARQLKEKRGFLLKKEVRDLLKDFDREDRQWLRQKGFRVGYLAVYRPFVTLKARRQLFQWSPLSEPQSLEGLGGRLSMPVDALKDGLGPQICRDLGFVRIGNWWVDIPTFEAWIQEAFREQGDVVNKDFDWLRSWSSKLGAKPELLMQWVPKALHQKDWFRALGRALVEHLNAVVKHD